MLAPDEFTELNSQTESRWDKPLIQHEKPSRPQLEVQAAGRQTSSGVPGLDSQSVGSQDAELTAVNQQMCPYPSKVTHGCCQRVLGRVSASVTDCGPAPGLIHCVTSSPKLLSALFKELKVDPQSGTTSHIWEAYCILWCFGGFVHTCGPLKGMAGSSSFLSGGFFFTGQKSHIISQDERWIHWSGPAGSRAGERVHGCRWGHFLYWAIFALNWFRSRWGQIIHTRVTATRTLYTHTHCYLSESCRVTQLDSLLCLHSYFTMHKSYMAWVLIY